MDLYQLRSFYEIVREQSFTRAADKLFLTQPAISCRSRHWRTNWTRFYLSAIGGSSV